MGTSGEYRRNYAGRTFNGTQHGDGVLAVNGDAGGAVNNTSTWPGTNAVGAGFRGGAWGYESASARVSDRYVAANSDAGRFNRYGARVPEPLRDNTWILGPMEAK